jgi:hypothetical protein
MYAHRPGRPATFDPDPGLAPALDRLALLLACCRALRPHVDWQAARLDGLTPEAFDRAVAAAACPLADRGAAAG